MDVLTPEQRQRCMARIKGRNTKPEVVLRKALFAMGFRYRLHQNGLPGRPDLVFPKYRVAMFVHGCFWHGHGCKLFVVPSTNREFWVQKIAGNRSRDTRAVEELRQSGWRVLTVWECTLRGKDKVPFNQLLRTIAQWLQGTAPLDQLPQQQPTLHKRIVET